MGKDTTVCVGMDIGDRYSQIAVLDMDGDVSEMIRVRTTPKAVQGCFYGKSPMRIAMEVGTHSPWLSRLLNQMGHEVLVANACKLRLIHKNDQKCDQVDAELLARICRFDPQLLYPINHMGETARGARSILRSRDALVRSRTMLINHARSIVKTTGHRLPKCTSQRIPKYQSELPESMRPALLPIFETVAHLNSQVRYYDKQIERIGQEQYPQTMLLRQVPGVGPITALTFVLTIGDPSRFSRNRAIGSFLGLVPRRNQTGQSDPDLPITKAGNAFLRRLLIQCACYILGPFGPDSDLRECGLRIASRGGKNAMKRARVAVARKLAVMLLSMLKNGEVYDPLRWSKGERTSVA